VHQVLNESKVHSHNVPRFRFRTEMVSLGRSLEYWMSIITREPSLDVP